MNDNVFSEHGVSFVQKLLHIKPQARKVNFEGVDNPGMRCQ